MIDFNDVPGDSGSGSSGRSSRYGSPFSPPVQNSRDLAPGEVPPYLEGLNPKQKEASMHTEGPLIVLAGAGSGKTKMLTSRIAYLIDVKGVAPNRILAVTFTNKAAREMRERVERGLGHAHFMGSPEIGTFHAICVRILRNELQATPFTKPFVIYDDSDQLSLVKRVFEKIGLDDKAFNPKSMQAAINALKCSALEPKDVEPEAHDIFQRQLKRVYEQYQKDLFANNALDFGEILCMVYRIFRDEPTIRSKYQNRWPYIHVDEYQDTNRAQYLMLSQLAKKEFGGRENICVVGDEDQSIYKWRGADIQNILDFEVDYPGAHTVKLEQNYRSTKTIITAAAQIIRNNKERKEKTLWTDNEEGVPIIRAALADEKAEAEYVVKELKKIASVDERSFKEFAIFYRTHAQSRQFEEVLRREKVPYEIVGGLRFYDRKEIKDVLSYFKVIQNPQDSISLKRIINTPARGIGKTTIDKLEAIQLDLERGVARANAAAAPEMDFGDGEIQDTSLWKATKLAASDPGLTSAGTARKLQAFVALIEKLIAERPKLLLSEMYHSILDETAYVAELRKEGTEEANARIENLEEFDTVLQEFEENLHDALTEEEIEAKKPELLSIFLEESALATDVASPNEEINPNSVQMMSLHASKGLEFPVVFLTGMEEGIFPSVRGSEGPTEEDLEEERRLCYVGVTRAREHLYLTHASIRRIWGQINYQEPSQFFQEIPDELIDFRDESHSMSFRQGSSRHFDSGRSRNTDDFSQVSEWDDDGAPKAKKNVFTNTSSGSYRIGKKVNHPDYGLGKILSQEGSGQDEKVTVQFSKGGPRKFLVRFIEGFIE